MIRVHTANQGDLGAMVEIDLRCFEYPIYYAELRDYLRSPDCFCVIAANDNHCVVGYAVFKASKPEGLLEIVRLAVLQKHRGLGAGKELLRAGRDYAITYSLHEMFVVVPEIICDPRSPGDVSRWLGFQGFKANKVIKHAFVMYGSKIDGFRFTKEVNVT